MERSNFRTETAAEALNMERRNLRNPDDEIALHSNRWLDKLALCISLHKVTRQLGGVVCVTKGYVVGTALGSSVTLYCL